MSHSLTLVRSLELFASPDALLKRYGSKDPKVIIAVPVSLSNGSSRQIFSEFALIPDNIVLLTSRAQQGTLGERLFETWSSRQEETERWDKGKIGKPIQLSGSMKLKACMPRPTQKCRP